MAAGRRGKVFSLRLTPEERARLEGQCAHDAGPKSLGPYLVWKAQHPSSGNTRDALERTTEARILRPAGEVLPAPAGRIILDLCGGSGSWSAPYRAAGYDLRVVTLPAMDVRTYVPPDGVHGILCAPPCTEFSLAKNGQRRDFVRGMECVNACLRIVQQARPLWWALENPVGLLGDFLGVPRDVFQPHDFGDAWTKRTALWGDFALPKRGPFVQPLGGGPPCETCTGERGTLHCSNSEHRAITPRGFAQAFFEANP